MVRFWTLDSVCYANRTRIHLHSYSADGASSVTLTLSVCVPDPILSFSADWGRKSLNLDCDSAEQKNRRE